MTAALWTSDEVRASLMGMAPQYGRVARVQGKGIVIDFSPEIRDSERYLWTFYGKPFASEAEAEGVRQRICEAARSVPIREAITQFRGRLSRKSQAWAVCDRFLDSAARVGSLRTGEPYAQRTIAHYRAVLTRAEPFMRGMTFDLLCSTRKLTEFRAWFRNERDLESDTEMLNAFIALKAVARFYAQERPGFRVEWPPLPSKTKAAQKNRKRRRKPEAKLTLPEVVQRIEAIPEARRIPFWLMFFTQSRIAEIRGILGVDYERPRVRIQQSADGKRAIDPVRDSTKTDEDGAYTLPDWLCDLIDQYSTAAASTRRRRSARIPTPELRLGRSQRMLCATTGSELTSASEGPGYLCTAR